ncbi:DNA alkylation repair protein [Alkalihalophilus lindianensis]|uniref:DNA alkylation repair protein n=1 Tax=Alkalihalophilus lindianensis TaxID=1630542 RepID=A0ABU3X5G4_9BACI|nr:DNA alkylation repair protein [Alkalihalophilus lindianensis]MDV2682862.1 DNA alkylation repair protein [Alkalihalophilus lindianensis]
MNVPLDVYIQKLVDVFEEHTDREYAEWSRNYLRNQFASLGVRTPIRRKVTLQFLKEYGLPLEGERKELIFVLWNLPEREYQQAALDILVKVKKDLTPNDVTWISELIIKKSWWDTVDVLAPHIIGYMFQKYPKLIGPFAEQWIEDDNIWLQRSAILFQLKYKDQTDESRLFAYILRRADSEEFFVQKAIGWALREYAKTRPAPVKQFVKEHSLKPLSKREALKHLS